MPDSSGKRPIFFVRGRNDVREITLACQQCVGCRLERSRQWATRCLHESKMWKKNCFITLTYDDKHMPIDRSLSVKDFQLFMKRLRKRFGEGIRVFYCGEYGPRLGRPHYHALLFNFDFEDKKIWKKNDIGHEVYTSKSLEDLWKKGYCTTGDLTFESAAYCARYAMKKITGKKAEWHYRWTDWNTGVEYFLQPEFANQSRRPGLGAKFLNKFITDVYPSDFLIVNGKKARPPRFYDNLYEIVDPLGLEEIKFQREQKGEQHYENNTPERLKVREELTERKIKQLKREIR